MIGEYQDRIEEGVRLTAEVLELTDWLQFCYERLEAGDEDAIRSDPFYERGGNRPALTQDVADQMIAALDTEYGTELGQFPGYHRNRSGANALPEFSRLSPRARLAMAEGIDIISRRYELKKAQREVERVKDETEVRQRANERVAREEAERQGRAILTTPPLEASTESERPSYTG